MSEEYPYLCTYSKTIEEADLNDRWMNWNGITGTLPNFIRDKATMKTYEFHEWFAEIITRPFITWTKETVEINNKTFETTDIK